MAALEVFCLVWCICVIVAIGIMGIRALRQKRKLISTLYNRPSIKYVKKRLLVRRIFKDKFLDIKVLSKRLYFKEEHIRMRPFLAKPKFDLLDLEVPNGGIRHGIAAIMGESIGTPTKDLLMEKMRIFYDELMEDEEDKDLVHKAIRFEIKNNCIRNPYDIFGAKLCKLIESSFQDIIDMKEERPYSFVRTYFPIFYDIDISSCRSWIILKTHHILAMETFKVHQKRWIFMGCFCAILIILIAILLLYHYKLYLELVILVILFVLDFIIIAIARSPFKKENFYAEFTLSSLVLVVSQVIFLTVGLYVYDYFTDIQVFLEFTNATNQATNHTINHGPSCPSFNGFPDYSIIGLIKEFLCVDDERNISEIHTPVVFLGMLLFLTTIITVPSLGCIKNQIDVYLVMNGKLRGSRVSGSFRKRVHSISYRKNEEEERHLLWRIIKRNELSISEAGVESTYQFMTQWAIFFSIHFWIDLYREAERLNRDGGNTFMSCTSEDSTFADIEKTRHIDFIAARTDFAILWKSGLLSFLSLSYAQAKLNDIQHELSLDLKQRILYYLASICNTISYGSLLVLFATNVFDFIPLARDWIDEENDEENSSWLLNLGSSKVELFVLFIFTLYPLIANSVKRAIKLLFIKHLKDEVKPDILAETSDIPECNSIGRCLKSTFQSFVTHMSGFTGVFHFKFLQLPTSQSFQYKNTFDFHSVSYNCRVSVQLLSSFLNQCFLYIVLLTSIICLGGTNLYLLHFDENLEELKKIDRISPSLVSQSRRIFIILCCITIPGGFFLGNVFLNLYFKYDRGFFTVSQLHFQYTPNEDNEVTGSWIDLNGQENHLAKSNELILTHDEKAQEGYYRMCLSLNEIESQLFDEIKESFPYYQSQKLRKMKAQKKSNRTRGSWWKSKWKNRFRLLVLIVSHFMIINYLLSIKSTNESINE